MMINLEGPSSFTKHYVLTLGAAKPLLATQCPQTRCYGAPPCTCAHARTLGLACCVPLLLANPPPLRPRLLHRSLYVATLCVALCMCGAVPAACAMHRILCFLNTPSCQRQHARTPHPNPAPWASALTPKPTLTDGERR
jgi:hypothetical protein